MGRLPRVYIEGILYYITSKAGISQNLFKDQADFNEYISLIEKYKQQYNFKLFSFALMPSHLHLLIELRGNVSISTIMHDINSLYTKLYNSRYSKRGHLFQERFKTTLAQKEIYLLKLTRHVHLNPIRVNLVNDPKEYLYSSHNQYLDQNKRQYPNLNEEIEEVFNMLKGREDEFNRYVSNPDQKEIYGLKKELRRKRILGPRDFAQRIEETIEESIREQKRKPLPKRVRITYMLLGGTAILAFAFSVVYFYRFQKQSTEIRTDQQKTLSLYKNALEMLEQARDEDLKENKDVSGYEWKIGLTERALREFQKQIEMEGYVWVIEFTQISGPKIAYIKTDEISFKGNHFNTIKLSKAEGFLDSVYSTEELEGGDIAWETLQTNDERASVSWQGEWDGTVMKGVMKKKYPDGTVRVFSFMSKGERVKKE